MPATPDNSPPLNAADALRKHWPVYAIEAALLGAFMISACFFTTLFENPESPLHQAITSPLVRRAWIGLAMGLTAVGLIYSKPGRWSGAHMNPATTLSFLRLGKMNRWDAGFYIAAQFIGGAAGVAISAILLGARVSHPNVNDAVTVPGEHGIAVAWAAEFVIAFVMMSVILGLNRFPPLSTYTGCFAAMLVVLYITFEAPLSGMSLNPARTFGSAVVARVWTGLWIYFTAPVAGMLSAVELHRFVTARRQQHLTLCCKLSHCAKTPCIFRCQCVPQANPAPTPVELIQSAPRKA